MSDLKITRYELTIGEDGFPSIEPSPTGGLLLYNDIVVRRLIAQGLPELPSWEGLGPVAETLRRFGQFGPTVNASARELKGVAIDYDEGGLMKSYLTADELREAARHFEAAATWLDRRASALTDQQLTHRVIHDEAIRECLKELVATRQGDAIASLAEHVLEAEWLKDGGS
jgi:hypothetical protein